VGSWRFSGSGSLFNTSNRFAVEILRARGGDKPNSGLLLFGASFALRDDMKEPSPKRKRTLALQERAILFSVNVNGCCPEYFSNQPSKVVWGQLVRAGDSTSNNLVEADDAVSDAARERRRQALKVPATRQKLKLNFN
jgi:hypothetical protein